MPQAARIRLSAALVGLACFCGLSAPATDAAASSPPGRAGLYGGGAVTDYLQFVSLRVLRSGELSAHATLVTRCAPRFGDRLTESVSVSDVKLDAAGRYSATTSFSQAVDPDVPLTGGTVARGTIEFSVRVGLGGLARGAVRVQTRYGDPDGGAELTRCDTGEIAWTARRPAPDAGYGPFALQPGIHRGTTGRHQPFLMRVAGAGRVVRRAGLTVRTDCPSAAALPLDVVAQRMRVRDGRFGATGSFSRPFVTDGRRVVERYSWELRGRFGRRGARGSFEMVGVVRRRSDGRRVGSCRTGAIGWRASR